MSKFQFVTCIVILCLLSGWLIGMATWMVVLRYQRGPFESLPMFFVTVSCAVLLMIGISLGAVTGSHWIKAEAAPADGPVTLPARGR